MNTRAVGDIPGPLAPPRRCRQPISRP